MTVVAKTLTTADIDLAKNQAASIANSATPPADPKQFVFFAAFDGTNNNKNNVGLSGTSMSTNVGQLFDQVVQSENVQAKYYPGPGTEGTLAASSWLAPQVTAQIRATAETAYNDFNTKAAQWLSENPGGSVTSMVTGFSRGGTTAAVFSQLLYERGVVDPATGAVLAAPGTVGVSGGVIFDPVNTNVNGNVAFAPNTENLVATRASNEYRYLFKGTELDGQAGDVIRVNFMGNHVDNGGGYDNGLGALSLGGADGKSGAMGYFLNKGLSMSALPAERLFKASDAVIHSEGTNPDGTRIWDEYGAVDQGSVRLTQGGATPATINGNETRFIDFNGQLVTDTSQTNPDNSTTRTVAIRNPDTTQVLSQVQTDTSADGNTVWVHNDQTGNGNWQTTVYQRTHGTDGSITFTGTLPNGNVFAKSVTTPVPNSPTGNTDTVVSDGQGHTIKEVHTDYFIDDEGVSRIELVKTPDGKTIQSAYGTDGVLSGSVTTTPTAGGGRDRIILASVDNKLIEIDGNAIASDAGPGGVFDDADFTTTAITIKGQTPGASGISNAALNAAVDQAFDTGVSSADLIAGRYSGNGNGALQHIVAVADTTNPTGTVAPIGNPGATGNWWEDPDVQRATEILGRGMDAQNLILALRSGKPLAIATSLSNNLSHLFTNNPALSQITADLGLVGNLKGFADALNKGDWGQAILSGGTGAKAALSIYRDSLQDQLLNPALTSVDAAALSDKLSGTNGLLQDLGTALGVLSIVNSLAHGDIKGAAISAIALIPGWGPFVALGITAFDMIFGAAFSGNGTFTANGSYKVGPGGALSYQLDATQAGGLDGQDDSHSNADQVLIKFMNDRIADTQKQAAVMSQLTGTPMGLIMSRMPQIAFSAGESYLWYRDPKTSQIYTRTFDLKTGGYLAPGYVQDVVAAPGNLGSISPWGANPQNQFVNRNVDPKDVLPNHQIAPSDDFYKDITQQFSDAVFASGAIAPQWEVDTVAGKNTSGLRTMDYFQINNKRALGLGSANQNEWRMVA